MNTPYSRDLSPSDAVLLLDPPTREAPDVGDTSRAAFSYGLILAIPAALMVLAFMLLTRLTATMPAWPLAGR